MFISNVFSLRPVVHTDMTGKLSMNITLDNDKYVLVEATPSIGRFISDNYTETIYYSDGTLETFGRMFDKYSHWTGSASFSTNSTGSVAFSIRDYDSIALDSSCPVHFIKGLIRDYGTGFEYVIEPVSVKRGDVQTKWWDSGIYELGEHTIDVSDHYRRHLNQDNDTDSCGGGLIVPSYENFTFLEPNQEILIDLEYVEIESRYLLLQIDNDNRRCNDLGVDGAAQNTLDIINIVSIYFEDAGVQEGFIYKTYIVLTSQTFFVDEDPWENDISPNSNGEYSSDDVLDGYRNWVINSDNSGFHVSHIFTHRSLQSGVLGLAYVGVVCFENYAIGLDKVNTGSIRPIYVTVHELGHNFGMNHDGSSNSCDNSYIMAPYVKNTLNVTWSQCSVTYFNTLAVNNGMDCLLKDQPTDIWQDVCGDGLVTGSEECDTRGVDDACCNGANCTLWSGVKCSYENDPCCTPECTFIQFYVGEGAENNVLCREADGDCDVPEYCHGNSGECPDDIYLPNGDQCLSDIYETSGICYNGMCMNGDDVCESYSYLYGIDLYDGGCVRYDCDYLVCGMITFGCLLVGGDEPDGLSCGDDKQCVDGQCVDSIYIPQCGNGVVDSDEECDCGSGDCFEIDDLCDARTCTYYVSMEEGVVVYEWDLSTIYSYNNDIGNWTINSTGNYEFRYRGDLDAVLLRSGNLTRTLEDQGYTYYYVEGTVFSRNMENEGDECFLLFSTDSGETWGYPELLRLDGKNYEKDEIKYASGIYENNDGNLLVRFGTIGNGYYDTCFLKDVKVIGYNSLDSFNRTVVYNYTENGLDEWLKISNNDFNVNGDIVNINSYGTGYIVYYIDNIEADGYSLFVNIGYSNFNNDNERCVFDYSVDRGLTWSEYVVVLNSTTSTDLTGNVVFPVSSLLFRITLENMGNYDFCYINNIVLEKLDTQINN